MGQVTNWPDKCLTPLRDKISIAALVAKVFFFKNLLSFHIYSFFSGCCMYI